MQETFRKRVFMVYSILFLSAFFMVSLFQLNIPDLSLDTLSENFLWRKDLIKELNNFRFLAGDQVFPQAIIGTNGWMYLSGDKSIEDYQKKLRLNPKEMRGSVGGLALFNKELRKNGTRLIVMVAPDKHTIYPQYMPRQIPVLGEMSRMDQFMKFMQENKNNIEVMDLRPALLKNSSSYQLYEKTDTHWNCLGAYYAYQEMMARISATYPETAAHPLTDFTIKVTGNRTRDISKMLGFQYREGGWKLNPKFKQNHLSVKNDKVNNINIRTVENSRKDLPTVMVFHDSFYIACFNTFFEQHFSRTISIHSRLVNDYRQLIEKEKPDIIIIEAVERNIADVISYFNK